LKYFQAKGFPPEGAMEKVLPLRPVIHNLFNPANTYGDFLLPALFILILHQTLLIGLGESVTLENQRGTLKELFAKTNESPLRLIHAKSLYYIGLYIAYALLTYSVIFPIFGIKLVGDYFLLMLLTFVFIMAIIYITFLIGSFFTKQIVIMETLAFTSYPIFLVSGFSWPLDSLPTALQYLANLMPITPFYSAFTRIVEMGASWTQVAPQIIHLSVLTLVYLALALWRFKVMKTKISP
jgi:ABC-2 type transport system permease protein